MYSREATTKGTDQRLFISLLSQFCLLVVVFFPVSLHIVIECCRSFIRDLGTDH